MFDTVCTIPLNHEVFAQAVHPAEPIVSVGLASGHVHTYRIPIESGVNRQIETTWETRRHKGSCRTLAFGVEGDRLYSAGTDGIVKAADVATGQVTAKIAIPPEANRGGLDHPTIVHTLSPQTLLLATDSSALHLYDLRDLGPKTSPKPQQTHRPHDDYISSLTPLPPTSASTSGYSKQWVSTGGSTLAVTDLRRGVMVRSEDQEEELLSSVMVTGLSSRGTSVGEKVIVGGGTGVLTLWERGVWDDQDERITIDAGKGGGESLDALALFPDGVGPGGKMVAVGLGNGSLSFVRIQPNKVVAELKHDELQSEAVVGLDFDVTGRLISGGGKMIKVWHEKLEGDDGDDEDIEEEDAVGGLPVKRAYDSSDDSDQNDEEESSEDEKAGKKRKKRKRRKGKKGASNGIIGFTGLD